MRIIIIYAFHYQPVSTMFLIILHKKKIFYDFLTFLSVQYCKSAAHIATCMYVCTERFELSLLHPPPPRKQTRHPRVYTHIAAWGWARYIKYPYKK